MTFSGANAFSTEEFIQDMRRLAIAIDAPFSEAVTSDMIELYGESFRRACVAWRITNQQNGTLNYRIF